MYDYRKDGSQLPLIQQKNGKSENEYCFKRLIWH